MENLGNPCVSPRLERLRELRGLRGALPQLVLAELQVLREGVSLRLHRLALLRRGFSYEEASRTYEKTKKSGRKHQTTRETPTKTYGKSMQTG